MKQFNKDEQLIFWQGNKEPFKGDLISKSVIVLSKQYIGSKSIDIGGGSGTLLENFQFMFETKKIVSIDLVPKSPKVIQGDCTQLNYGNHSFDTVFCMDVIEHLGDNDLDMFLNEVNRVLKNGGYGIFTTINNENLQRSIVTCPECGANFHRWGHCQVFTETFVRKLFESKGFKIVKVKKMSLSFFSKYKMIAEIFYSLKLEKLLKFNFFTEDLFFIVKKNRDFEISHEKF